MYYQLNDKSMQDYGTHLYQIAFLYFLNGACCLASVKWHRISQLFLVGTALQVQSGIGCLNFSWCTALPVLSGIGFLNFSWCVLPCEAEVA